MSKPQKHWMNAVLAEAAKPQPAMPWARGKRTGRWKARLLEAGNRREAASA